MITTVVRVSVVALVAGVANVRAHMSMMKMDNCPMDDQSFVEQGYLKIKDLFDLMQEGILNGQWYEVGKLAHGIGGGMQGVFHACTHLMTEDELLKLQKEILEQVHGKPFIVMDTPLGRMLVQDEVEVPDDIRGMDGQ